MTPTPDWTTLPDIRRKLEKRWQRGDLLRAWQQPEGAFPLRLPLKKPSPRQLNEQFEAARNWVRHWQTEQTRGDFVLEWQAINHRQLGRNQLPVAILLETREQMLRLAGKLKQAQSFSQLFSEITAPFPQLSDWCLSKPLLVLDKKDDWARLLATATWLCAHSQPGIYLRQLEVPGVHTKFIERNRGLLSELLDRLLPESAIAPEYSGASRFEQRYGFLSKPAQVRFRILDPACRIAGLADLQIPVADFKKLAPGVETVFIVENEITALAFPEIRSALVIFGQGYGVDQLLAGARWLDGKDVFYWGDLDTHGFAILDQLRRVIPHARSLLMDRLTLVTYEGLWGQEPSPTARELGRLTSHEQSVYETLVNNTLGERVRLEQERISFVRSLMPALAAAR